MPVPLSVRQLLPSLVIDGEFAGTTDVTCRVRDLQALLNAALQHVEVDEAWYLDQYPDVEEGIGQWLVCIGDRALSELRIPRGPSTSGPYGRRGMVHRSCLPRRSQRDPAGKIRQRD